MILRRTRGLGKFAITCSVVIGMSGTALAASPATTVVTNGPSTSITGPITPALAQSLQDQAQSASAAETQAAVAANKPSSSVTDSAATTSSSTSSTFNIYGWEFDGSAYSYADFSATIDEVLESQLSASGFFEGLWEGSGTPYSIQLADTLSVNGIGVTSYFPASFGPSGSTASFNETFYNQTGHGWSWDGLSASGGVFGLIYGLSQNEVASITKGTQTYSPYNEESFSYYGVTGSTVSYAPNGGTW
jgi:hypothetical protein